MSLPRAAAALRAIAVPAALLTTLLVPVPAGTAAEAETVTTPLTVRLTRLSPATIPARGQLTLAGSVKNSSEETWSAVNVHPFLGSTPMTTRDELAAAAASDPETEVGQRITKVGEFAPIGDLEPGQTARFEIKLPVADLPRLPGAYWIGVHALGQNTEGRDGLADGRARTFIPLVEGTQRTSVSLVVPLRERVRRDADGRLLDTTAWSQTLGHDGRLRRIMDFVSSVPGAPATLLVDPAVLEAIESVASDNPVLSLGTAPETEESPPSSPSPSRSTNRLDATDRANATSWLALLTSVTRFRTVLGLGYADPDAAALARHRPALLARSARLAKETFDRLEIGSTPAIAPPDGWLDDDALAAIDAESLVLVSDHNAPRTRTQWRTTEDQDLVFADAQASSGGPGPTAPLDALALRQRIVSDAALRATEGGTGPMVVELPPDWDPGPGWQASRFFESLEQPWLDLIGPATASPSLTPTFDAALGYPASERRLEIGVSNIGTAGDLVETGIVMSQLLRTENQIEHVLSGAALSAVSYQARKDRAGAREQVLATNGAMRNRLGQVEVTGTDFVTLSGGTGTVAVTLVNRLDEPITVGISSSTGSSDVRIATPEPVEMAPGERTVLRLKASASSIGVHQVTLTPVTTSGAALGTPLTFSLRTSQVGAMIWIILLAGAGLLVVMIGRRILRGVREHRWRGQ